MIETAVARKICRDKINEILEIYFSEDFNKKIK